MFKPNVVVEGNKTKLFDVGSVFEWCEQRYVVVTLDYNITSASTLCREGEIIAMNLATGQVSRHGTMKNVTRNYNDYTYLGTIDTITVK